MDAFHVLFTFLFEPTRHELISFNQNVWAIVAIEAFNNSFFSWTIVKTRSLLYYAHYFANVQIGVRLITGLWSWEKSV